MSDERSGSPVIDRAQLLRSGELSQPDTRNALRDIGRALAAEAFRSQEKARPDSADSRLSRRIESLCGNE